MNTKTVVISGAGGLGCAIATQFLTNGWRVFLLSKSTKLLFKEHPQKDQFTFLTVDLTKVNEVTKAIAEIKTQVLSIDACVHTATAPLCGKKLFDLTPEEFSASFNVDVFGGFTLIQQVAGLMKQQGFGSIVALSTAFIEPGVSHPPLAGYISAKFALRGLLRELAKELAPFGVRVNAVAPGFVPAGLNHNVPARLVELLREKNPMGKLPSPEDVATIVNFLCSDQSVSLTGLHLPVNFGESLTL